MISIQNVQLTLGESVTQIMDIRDSIPNIAEFKVKVLSKNENRMFCNELKGFNFNLISNKGVTLSIVALDIINNPLNFSQFISILMTFFSNFNSVKNSNSILYISEFDDSFEVFTVDSVFIDVVNQTIVFNYN